MNNNEQEKLQRLLKKYLAGELSPEEEAFVTNWYDNLKGKLPSGMLHQDDLEKQKNANWESINAKLKQTGTEELKESDSNQKKFTIRPVNSYWVGIAATILLLIGYKMYPNLDFAGA